MATTRVTGETFDRSGIDGVGNRWALYLLTLVYMFNMLDRQIITILVEPMKRDLSLSDGQIGAVSGLAFALLYTVAGIPLARLADRSDRVRMIAIALAVWSGFTVLCGFARNFGEMVAARVGVGIGEAGCTPAAHSFITDYVAPEKRASALATYQLGVPLGSLAGLAIGGLLLSWLGWRAVFILAGVPGVALAFVLPLYLKDPRRRRTMATSTPVPALRAVMREFAGRRAFWCIAVASSLAAFGFFGISAFFGSLYLRTHSEALTAMATNAGLAPTSFLGLMLGALIGLCGGIGTIAGGRLADRARRAGIAGYATVPFWALLVAMPMLASAALANHIGWSFTALGAGMMIYAMTYGPVYGAIQSLASPPMRAMASAIQIFLVNAIGLGLGPVFVGVMSDILLAEFGPVMGLRLAMAAATLPILLAALLFWIARRTIAVEEVR